MKTQNKIKKHQTLKVFDVGAYELFNNRLYRHKIIPNKKKAEILKRKKVDIKEYQPFLFVMEILLSPVSSASNLYKTEAARNSSFLSALSPLYSAICSYNSSNCNL